MYERTYHKSVLKQEGLPKERRPFPWKRFLLVLGILAAGVGFVFLTRIPAFQITAVSVEGVRVADPEDISQFILDDLSGYTFKVLPRGSVMLLSTNALEERLYQAFPRFSSVNISRAGTGTLSVSISEYAGVYVWCAQGVDLNDCYFMDEKGMVFAEAPYFSGSAYPKVFVGEQQELPFKPISDIQLETMKTLIERLPTVSVTPTAFHFLPGEVHVFFLHNGTESKIVFNEKAVLDQSLETLFSGMRVQAFASMYHSTEKVLEYIDLRFSNKMVYKFQ